LWESLGTSILIQAAAVAPAFTAIVAESPYADLREIAEYRVRRMLGMPGLVAIPAAKAVVGSAVLYARWIDGLDLRHVSPISDIAHESTPILLIHGLKDSPNPAEFRRRVLNWFQGHL
jgi:dipeptidyl aminopeptidase/acylaminoacyl peptidase